MAVYICINEGIRMKTIKKNTKCCSISYLLIFVKKQQVSLKIIVLHPSIMQGCMYRTSTNSYSCWCYVVATKFNLICQFFPCCIMSGPYIVDGPSYELPSFFLLFLFYCVSFICSYTRNSAGVNVAGSCFNKYSFKEDTPAILSSPTRRRTSPAPSKPKS